ncbi:NusA-like transcription termination signal-binding factor [Nanoarchaeota archaeon]
MEKIIFDVKLMKLISMFESLSGAHVKDCLDMDNYIMFIVDNGQMGKAIGKSGSNIKRIENALKKNVKVVEFNEDINEFVKSLLYPTVPEEVQLEGGVLTITGKDARTRGIIIGRDRSKLKFIKQIIGRYFSIEDIKVV